MIDGTDTQKAIAWENPEHAAWLGLSARMGRFVSGVAGRGDLVATVSPDVRPDEDQERNPRPIACFVPRLAEVRFTATKIWAPTVDPATVDPNDGLDRARHPQMVGAACHEAAHAAHTHLVFPTDSDPAARRWAVLLEEPRIEARLVTRRPADRVWLRAAAIQLCAGGVLALPEQEQGTSRAQAVRTAVLFLGRVAAGVLDRQETATLRDGILDVLGAEAMAEVDAVLGEAVGVADGDTEALVQLGGRLAALVKDHDQPDAGDGEAGDGEAGDGEAGDGEAGDGEAGDGEAGDGEAGDGEAERLPCGSWTEGEVPDDVDPWTGDTPAAGNDDGPAPAITDAIRATAEQVAEDADRKAKAAAFTPPRQDPGRETRRQDAKVTQAAYQRGFGGGAAPIIVTERPPTAPVQEQARRLTWALRRAQFRAVTRTKIPTAAPPGRMRMGEMMRRDAQKAARARITAQPWKQTRRREAPQPPLTVGFSGDVSGSMQEWQTVTADMSWAVAHAVAHLWGTAAAVAWNTDVAPTLRPGQTPPHVQEATCRGGSEGCALSLRALDGALGLTQNPEGARAVVVVTDGALGDTYPLINGEVRRLTRTGVKVLWVTPTSDFRVHPSVTNLVLSNPDEFGDAVGQALADLLAAV